MKKINKAAARKLYAEGKPFWIVACNLRPQCGILIGSSSFERMADVPFDTMVNSYEYYNCTNETGRYAAFYTDDE
jgi:hypothetical protein